MTFDKEQYWKNRKACLRGQGPEAHASHLHLGMMSVAEPYKPSTKPLSRYAVRKNTRRAQRYAARVDEQSKE